MSDESVLPWRSTWPGTEVEATWGGAPGTWALRKACTKDAVFYTKDHSEHKDPRKTLRLSNTCKTRPGAQAPPSSLPS